MRGQELILPCREATGEGDHAQHGGGGEIGQGGSDMERMLPPPPPLRGPPPPQGGGGLNEVVLAAARGWLGTPYRHQASVKGEGADCLGLVRGVWREVVGEEPEALPPYRADWAEVGGEETLLHAARRRLAEVTLEMARPGDVLLFRMSAGCPVKHCAILSADDGPEWRMIHAYWGRAVVESWMGPWWRRRLVAAFRWPATKET